MNEREPGCTCQRCGRKYRVDLLLPNYLWDRINPEGVNLLCGACIVEGLEAQGFGAWRLTA